MDEAINVEQRGWEDLLALIRGFEITRDDLPLPSRHLSVSWRKKKMESPTPFPNPELSSYLSLRFNSIHNGEFLWHACIRCEGRERKMITGKQFVIQKRRDLQNANKARQSIQNEISVSSSLPLFLRYSSLSLCLFGALKWRGDHREKSVKDDDRADRRARRMCDRIHPNEDDDYMPPVYGKSMIRWSSLLVPSRFVFSV